MINGIINFAPFFIIASVIYLFILSHRQVQPINNSIINFTGNPHTEYAFATFTTPAFCMGAIVLGHSLIKSHGNKYDRICLVSPDVNETWVRILSQWWTVVRVRNFKPSPGFRRSWAKLYLWDLTSYKKIVYMDTDMIAIKNLDELFKYPQLSCVPDPSPPQICNSGVLVLEPKPGLTKILMKTSKTTSLIQGIGDQSFINSFFGQFTPLPPYYSIPRTQGGSFGWAYDHNFTRVIHYVCKKPWKCGREGVGYCGCGYPSFNKLWYQYFDEACSNHECIESWVE